MAGEYLGMLLVLLALAAVFGSRSDRFLTLATLTTLVNQVPALTMVAVGMTFVLITGGIDLSVGSVIALSAQIVLRRTLFGRYCTAIGFNETVVKYSGIDPRWTRIAAFVVCGSLAGVAGVIETSRLASADSNAAIGFELSAIAAAVIGGTSLMGGRGSIINTFFGVLIIAVLQAGLAHLGVREGTKGMITGSVIVAAVLLDASRGRLRAWMTKPGRNK